MALLTVRPVLKLWRNMKKINCEKCPFMDCPQIKSELKKNSDILIVGEAPGVHEVEENRPFSIRGVAGGVMRDGIQKYLEGRSVSLTNVILCRPPGNKTPTRKEFKNCFNRLKKDIEFVNPRLIIASGDVALQAITGKRKITKYNAQLLTDYSSPIGVAVPVVAMVHPMYCKYNNDYSYMKKAFKKVLWFFEEPLIPEYKEVRNIEPTDEVVAMDIETSSGQPHSGVLRCFAISNAEKALWVNYEKHKKRLDK